MGRYYFDIDDGRTRERDPDGQCLPSLWAARNTAVHELALIVRDELPDGDRATYVVVVRDEARVPVIVATASILCEVLDPDAT
ncbi:DUF6894 family protein [Roseivivax isoporae]|uniref:DUF6894 domain-containing protein n=1 Tax=Roseivivax isoporae LMG 25204 TaxID=1449351 RepID=X7F902_9RHOB|nr:hypothetical protein [Roseivivax isoporae]ETX29208.1 hypothetical protein RISW2_02005 [Roseivivax isoporae LMG 25204]